MSSEITSPDLYMSFERFAGLRKLAEVQSGSALQEVAKQFESLFLQMMLKSMRDANLADGIMDNDQSQFFQEMYDKQVTLDLSKRSNIGLADLIVKQLDRANGLSHAADGGISPEHRLNPTGVASQSADRSRKGEIPAVNKVNHASRLKDNEGLPINNPDDFVRQLMPYAQQAAREIGVNPGLLIAQAALETGWGKAVIQKEHGVSSFNLFGIKADHRWHGDRVSTTTVEFRGGIAEKSHESFRSYSGYQESFEDYVRFLKDSSRYEEALKNAADPVEFIRSLQAAGYATDPEYANKVIGIFERNRLDT